MKKRPDVLTNWDEVQHDPLTIPPDDFSEMSLDEAVAAIEEWFFENFEDPANSTPHESAEGGYQYIWGGPYDTRDVIENVFADSASDELITAAIESLDRQGGVWVPSIGRRQGPDDDERPEPPDDPAVLHAEMLRRVAALEEVLEALPVPSAGIGHNNPPELIEPIPYTAQDRTEIEAALVVLNAQTVTPPEDGEAAVAATRSLEEKGNKFRGWLARQADNFASEFFKESGKELAKWGSRALFVLFVERLLDLSTFAMKWLVAMGLGLPF